MLARRRWGGGGSKRSGQGPHVDERRVVGEEV